MDKKYRYLGIERALVDSTETKYLFSIPRKNVLDDIESDKALDEQLTVAVLRKDGNASMLHIYDNQDDMDLLYSYTYDEFIAEGGQIKEAEEDAIQGEVVNSSFDDLFKEFGCEEITFLNEDRRFLNL